MIPKWPTYESGNLIGIGDRVNIIGSEERFHGKAGTVKGVVFRDGMDTRITVSVDGREMTEWMFTDELEEAVVKKGKGWTAC